jgi:hypothetical protein
MSEKNNSEKGSKNSVLQNIQTYLRVRPTANKSPNIILDTLGKTIQIEIGGDSETSIRKKNTFEFTGFFLKFEFYFF